MTIQELWARRRELANSVNDLITNGDHDEALRVDGQIREIDEEITRATAEQERERNAAAENLITEQRTFAEAVFGPQANFEGINPGFEGRGPIRDAISGLPTPQIYHTDLPSPVAPPTGFLATLAHGTTDGDEHFFEAPVLDNKAAEWVSGKKAESALKWTEATAPLATIAHWMPIKRQTARRYRQLESIVANALLMGLDLKADSIVLTNEQTDTGITGILKYAGTLQHTKIAEKNLKDTFAAMKRKVRVASGVPATHVCISPYAIEELSEEKDQVGRYLFPDIGAGGTIAGLTVVEDVNMTGEKEMALVYYSAGATFNIADPQEVTIGLKDSQLIENEYTLLAEMTANLRVDMPAAFCVCSDIGLEIEAAVKTTPKAGK